jgi:hypothetical protein
MSGLAGYRSALIMAALTFAAVLELNARAVRADYITLRSGGEIRGELLSGLNRAEGKSKSRGDRSREERSEFISIRTLSGATVAVETDEVESVVRRRMVLEEYETLRRATPDTVEAQWDLAEWCRQKSLAKERETHLRAVVALDPEHTAAHRGLGHIHDSQGRWSTRDEMMTSRGYVKYKGKYVLPQELELIQQDERVSEAEKVWFRRVRQLHGWLDSGRTDRHSEALKQLKEIHDPDAVPALSKTFKTVANEEQRLLYVEILTRIIGDKPVPALVLQSLWDESQDIRSTAIGGLLRKDVSKALPYYLRALKNGLNIIVNRAGDALAHLGNDAVVPQLINALVTRHVYTELVPDGAPGISTNGAMVPVGQPILPPNIELLLATGQLPQGVRVEYPATPVRMKEVTYEKDERNPSVLGALSQITGQDFGFDESTWRRWYNSQRNNPGAKKKKSKP